MFWIWLIQLRKHKVVVQSMKVLRLSVFALFIFVGLSVFFMFRSKANVEDMMMGLGHQMMRFPGERSEGVREMAFNGAKVFVKSRTLKVPQEKILDVFEQRCLDSDGGINEEFEKLEGYLAEMKGRPKKEEAFDGVMRMEDDDMGVVSCLHVPPEGKEGFQGLLDRVENFSQSGNLSDVGYLRYLYTLPDKNSAETQTFVLSIWSDSEINIKKMFPSGKRDAAGSDIQNFPRPPESHRLLSMNQKGAPYAVNAYKTKKDELEVRSFYRRHFQHAELVSDQFATSGLLVFQEGDFSRSVIIREKEHSTNVTLLQTKSDEQDVPNTI